MAGKFFSFINPQYSILWTRDLGYLAGTGDASGVNPFNPRDLRPLVEGEWLERVGTNKVTRGGNNAMASPGTPDHEGSNPAFPYFNEEGRYDAQSTKLAHIVVGPAGFEFRTKLCNSDGLSVNSQVSVWDWDGRSSAFGLVRRVLAAYSSGLSVGRVTRVHGTDDISVYFQLGL